MMLEGVSKLGHFYVREDERNNCYWIECNFTVYRQKFGHHPSWLPQDEERGRREGFPTSFWFLVEDDLTKEEAEKKLQDLYNQYEELIEDIENDDKKWDEFPWKDRPVVFSK